jgi:predicted nucleotidyltransferase
MNNNRQILTDLKNHLQNHYGKPIKNIILFGSQARGNSGEHSDYDVLIVLDQDYCGNDENQILDLCYDIDLKYNILLDVHLISVRELNTIRGKQPVYINALKYGIYT